MEFVFLIEMDGREAEMDSLSEEQNAALMKKINSIARECIGYTGDEGSYIK